MKRLVAGIKILLEKKNDRKLHHLTLGEDYATYYDIILFTCAYRGRFNEKNFSLSRSMANILR